MSLEGCRVQAVLEICPFSNGLTRNIVQCLNDYDIPLHLSHTIVAIHGTDRVTGITAAKVDDRMRPIPGTEFEIECDTVLLSVGLIPENELSRGLGLTLHPLTGGPVVDQRRETSEPGIFAAGNVVHVHDLVDFVSDEAEIAGKFAAQAALGASGGSSRDLAVTAGENVRTCVPQHLRLGSSPEKVRLYMRVTKPMRGKLRLSVKSGGGEVFGKPLMIAKPSEMIAVDIPEAKVAALTSELVVSLEEGK